MSYPKVLFHKGKYGDTLIPIQNEHEERLAWLAMFHVIREWEGYYKGLESDQQIFYDKAMRGDWKEAKWLLQARNTYEYEYIEMACVDTPTELFEKTGVQKCGRCNRWLPNVCEVCDEV